MSELFNRPSLQQRVPVLKRGGTRFDLEQGPAVMVQRPGLPAFEQNLPVSVERQEPPILSERVVSTTVAPPVLAGLADFFTALNDPRLAGQQSQGRILQARQDLADQRALLQQGSQLELTQAEFQQAAEERAEQRRLRTEDLILRRLAIEQRPEIEEFKAERRAELERLRQQGAEERLVRKIEADNAKLQQQLENRLSVIDAQLRNQTDPRRARQEDTLRQNYLAQIKRQMDVRDSYLRVQTAANNTSPAGDLSLIFAYMKMLDPESVVREGEFATAQNTAGIPDRIRNSYNRLLKGERLNPTQRTDFLNQANLLFKETGKQKQQVDSFFRKIAERRGLDVRNVIDDFGFEQPPTTDAPSGEVKILSRRPAP